MQLTGFASSMSSPSAQYVGATGGSVGIQALPLEKRRSRSAASLRSILGESFAITPCRKGVSHPP